MDLVQIARSNLEGFRYAGTEVALCVLIVALLLSGVILPFRKNRRLFLIISMLGLALAMTASLKQPGAGKGVRYFADLFLWDSFSVFFKLFFVAAAAFTILMAQMNREVEDYEFNEYCLLVVSVTLGMVLLASSVDLLMIYLAFETMGLLSYLLVGIRFREARGGEAALKYVLYGAFTSGVMLFGFSLVYGLAGTTDIMEIGRILNSAHMAGQNRALFVLTVLFFLAGLLFKTASFPFHIWCPDVYEGAPTPVTAFLSVGPKAAGFAVFIRLFYTLFAREVGAQGFAAIEQVDWPAIVAVISAITMSLGNLSAIHQDNVKRLLAYSSIAHAGYLLMGIACLDRLGLEAVAFYLVVYLFMNLGAFAVVTAVNNGEGGEDIRFYRGLSARAPMACVAMAVFLFSLIGIPPFAGFVGKVFLFSAVILKKYYWLAIVAAINTVISLYYYVRLIKAMFIDQAEVSFEPRVGGVSYAVIGALALPTLVLGVYWQPLAAFIESIF